MVKQRCGSGLKNKISDGNPHKSKNLHVSESEQYK